MVCCRAMGLITTFLLLGLTASSFSKAVAASMNKTQAGCACLSNWSDDATGQQHSGCTNPDNDPMGPWCQVNPSNCLGYYSSYTSESTQTVFYDYCGDARERTVSGCLCAPDWSLNTPGVGKPHYRDRCASPESAGKRICKVDFATCPEGVTVGEYDTCTDSAATPQQQQPAKSISYNQCKCRDEWWFAYGDGSVKSFSGCANPDDDPLGPWCAVDPAFCDNFAGEIKQTVNETLSYDYCDKPYRPHFASSCALALNEFDQCGGKTFCSDTGCMDSPWPGACCPAGTECHRQNEFYFQCLSPGNVAIIEQYKLESGAYPDGGFFGLSGTAALPGSVDQPQTLFNPVSNFPASSSSLMGSSSTAASSSAAGSSVSTGYGGSVSQDLVRIYAKLKIDMGYAELDASPEKMSWFKSEITGWLKSVATDASYVQGAGVEEVYPGSVIVVSFLQFRPGTPLTVVQSTTARLAAETASLYAASKLPTTWGPLLGSTVAQTAADLMEISDLPLATQLPSGAGSSAAAAPDSAITGGYVASGAAFDATDAADARKSGSKASIGGGAIAGITIAGLVVIAISGFVISRTLADKERKKHDKDITAKLDYITELREVGPDGTGRQQPTGELASVQVGDGQSSLWSWLRKADTARPTSAQLAAKTKLSNSGANSTVSTLTAHCSDSFIAAGPSSAARPDNAISPSDQDAVFLPLPSNAILRTLSETEHSNADKLSTSSATAAAPAELGASPSPNPNAGAGSPQRCSSVEMPAATMHPASATLKHRRTSSASAAGGSSRKNSQDGQASEKSL